MAEDTFGMFNTTYRQPDTMPSLIDMAKLTPEQQAYVIGVGGAGRFGESVGRLFGGRTAAEAEMALMDEAKKEAAQVGTDEESRLAAFVSALRKRGLEGYAMQATKELDRVMKEKVSRGLITAQTGAATSLEEERRARIREAEAKDKAEKMTLAGRVAFIKRKMPDVSDEEAQGLASDENIIKELIKNPEKKFVKETVDGKVKVYEVTPTGYQLVQTLGAAGIRGEGAGQKVEKPIKPMPASLQKAEDTDFEVIDTTESLINSLKPVIEDLGGFDEKNLKPKLNLGAMNNLWNQARNFIGRSTPESLRYAQLQEAKTRIINDSLRLNKGTQTEGDAQRAAAEVEAAWGKNDTEATRKALVRLSEINNKVVQNKKAQIDRRRSSQGQEPFFKKQLTDKELVEQYLNK